MKTKIYEIIEKHKYEVEFRTDRTQATFGSPQLTQAPVRYEIAEKTRAVAHGGLALIHQIALRTGLYDALDSVSVLKHHPPYMEADHLLNIAYDFLYGGSRGATGGLLPVHGYMDGRDILEHYFRGDREAGSRTPRRQVADPTTAGNFCRRYAEKQMDALQDKINEIRLGVWALQGRSFFDEAVVDMDGTIAPTDGECKQGMDISYKGQWGYTLPRHNLLVFE